MYFFSSGGPPDHPFLLKLSITMEINHKKPYYNYYTSGKFLTLKFKFQGKSSDTPQLHMLRYVPAWPCRYDIFQYFSHLARSQPFYVTILLSVQLPPPPPPQVHNLAKIPA